MWPNDISGLHRTECKRCIGHRLAMGYPGINKGMSEKAMSWMRYRVRGSEWLRKRYSRCSGCLKVAKTQVKVLGYFLSRLDVI